MKKEYLYVICFNGYVGNIAFKDLDKAFEWLEKERGCKQIQGLQFTNGFTIKPVDVIG